MNTCIRSLRKMNKNRAFYIQNPSDIKRKCVHTRLEPREIDE